MRNLTTIQITPCAGDDTRKFFKIYFCRKMRRCEYFCWKSIITVYTPSTVQHIIAPIHVPLRAHILSATLRPILYSVPLIRLPRFIEFSFLTRFSLFSLFFREPFFFFLRDHSRPVIHGMHYILQLVVKHRTFPPPATPLFPNERLPLPSGVNVIKAPESPVVACTGRL